MADPLGCVHVQILCCLSERFVLPWAVPNKQTATMMDVQTTEDSHFPSLNTVIPGDGAGFHLDPLAQQFFD